MPRSDGAAGTRLPSQPLVTLYCVVHGPVYERYASVLIPQAQELFLPGQAQIVVLPGNGGWPHGSASRYQVCLDHQDQLEGEWLFQIDADMLIEQTIGEEILADGLTVTIHPGYPEARFPESFPYDRNPRSHAYVPFEHGTQYHPGAFVGGRRDAFLAMCATTMGWYEKDRVSGYVPQWYEESYLNRYLIDNPPALILPREYCWWADQWGPRQGLAKIVHLDKTAEEFELREAGRA